MTHSTPHLLELVQSDSLPRFPIDDDSLRDFGRDDRDDEDMARTLEVRPRQPTSPDVLCEIGVHSSELSSHPVWSIREAFPGRPPLPTVRVRQRHPALFRLLVPMLASVLAFTLTLALAYVFRQPLQLTLGSWIF